MRMAFGKLLSLYYVSCAVAWNVPGHDATEAPASPARRDFLLPTAPVVAAAAAAIAGASQLLLMSPPAAGAVTPSTETAAKQWESAAKTIDGLLDRWDTTYAKGGGDAIRAELGTQGVTSPLFQIDKALRVLRESASDVIEFTEQTDEFLLTLSRADSMAYSANFAGGSGKPTPPAVYIEKSRQEILDLQRAAQALSLQLKEDSS